MKRTAVLLGIIITIGTLLRLYALGSVPHGVTHDEMGYIYNSYTIARTGKNILGEPYPFLTYLYGKGFPFMPVTTYLSVLVFRVFPLSPFTGRLPVALLGAASIYLVYCLSKQLFGKGNVALLSAAVLAVSSWHIFWYRTAYDIGVAAFFYLAASVSFIGAVRRNRFPWLSIVCFLLALLSYRGMSPVSVPLMALLVWYARTTYVRSRIRLAAIGIGFATMVVLFAGVAVSQRGNGFISETALDMGKVAWDIELGRRATQGPERLKQVFINKPLYIMNRWVPNYLQAFSVGHLFLHGEGCQTCSISSRGKMYLADLFFVLAGTYFLLRHKQPKGSTGFVFGLLAVAAVPTVVLGEPYSSRALLMTVPFSMLIASGMDGIIRQRRWGIVLGAGIAVVYLFSVSHFLFDYFLRYAYHRADVWVADMREVTRRITDREDTSRTAVITGTSLVDILQYAFYAGIHPAKVQKSVKEKSGSTDAPYVLSGVEFTGNCAKAGTLREFVGDRNIGLVFGRPDCFREQEPEEQIRDFSGNTIWKIYYP